MRNPDQEPDGGQLRGETGRAGGSTGGAKESGTIYRTRGRGTQGVRSPGTDTRITEADYRRPDTSIPASGL